MGGILGEQTKVPPGRSLDTLGQPLEPPPESRSSAVHLEVFESPSVAGVAGLFDEEVEGSGF